MEPPTIESLAGGLSVLSAMIIQGNDVKIGIFGDGSQFGFELYRFERDNYRAIGTSRAGYVSEKDAREAAEGLVSKVKSWDLTDKVPGFIRSEYVPPENSVKP
ncbi:MAG: hypothetical protein IIA87_05560 [Nanoarchaeota archaeon]|nr:hypothetical protein [Nanoarchaeota archaeon]